jgi:hypothetical protein
MAKITIDTDDSVTSTIAIGGFIVACIGLYLVLPMTFELKTLVIFDLGIFLYVLYLNSELKKIREKLPK